MIKIGNLTLENNIFLAPMAGVTDLAFRLMCKKMGASLVYSEMISAKALHYNDKKTLSLLQTDKREAPLAVQIFGSDPLIMAEGAKKIEDMGFPLIDINMGCPAPKVTSNGDGSALLKDFKLIGEIVKQVSSAVSIPVTCKVRCGINDYIDICYLAKIIEDNGAKAICVHPRTAKMYYSGVCDKEKIRLAKNAVSIPVIGNGDTFTFEDAIDTFNKTSCDALMVARGARGNPFIFKQINEYLKNGKVTYFPKMCEKLKVMKEHVELICELKGEKIGVKEARKHIAWYTKSMPSGAVFRNEVFKCESIDTIIKMIDEYTNYIERVDTK